MVCPHLQQPDMQLSSLSCRSHGRGLFSIFEVIVEVLVVIPGLSGDAAAVECGAEEQLCCHRVKWSTNHCKQLLGAAQLACWECRALCGKKWEGVHGMLSPEAHLSTSSLQLPPSLGRFAPLSCSFH